MGRIQPNNLRLTAYFTGSVRDSKSLNVRRQAAAITVLRLQQMEQAPPVDFLNVIRQALKDPEPRLRHAAVLALREAGAPEDTTVLTELLARETDRVVYYSAWGALGQVATVPQRKALLKDPRAGVRRGAVLSLLEEDALTNAELKALEPDEDTAVAALVKRRLGGKAAAFIKGPSLDAAVAKQPVRAASVNPVDALRAASGRSYRVLTLRAGIPVYTDRNYRITTVPPVLQG